MIAPPALRRAVRFCENNGYEQSGNVKDCFGMPLFELVKTLEPGS